MKTSAAGVAFIAEWEGFVDHVYLDAGGLATVGYGHLVRTGEDFSGGVTKEQALALLAADVATAEDCVDGHTEGLSQNAFDACTSLTYNIGTGAFLASTVLHEIRAGNMEAAADAFLLWRKVNGQDNAGLLARREAERTLFLTA